MLFCWNIFKKRNNVDVSPTPSPSRIPDVSPSPSPSLTPPNIINNLWKDLQPIDVSTIQQYPFPEEKYFHEEYQKKQIVLHHTVSGLGIDGDVSTWANGKYNVGVAIIVDRLGIPWQLFSSANWAYHLGTGDHSLDKHSIAIEIDNWGGLILGDGTTKQFGFNEDGTPRLIFTATGKYYAHYGNAVNLLPEQIQHYPEGYREYNYYEKYTIEQIKTVGELVLFWKYKYNIPLYYNPSIFNFSEDAVAGKPGLWTHTSYRKDKSDIHPQPEMIEMLKAICTDETPISYRLKRKWFKLGRKKGHDVEDTGKFIW